MKTLTKAAWPVLLLASAMVWAASCTTIYVATVTLTSVMDSAAKSYATAFNDGLVPPDVADKAAKAHAKYQAAAGVAEEAFKAVKAGQNVDTRAALEAARSAASEFVNLLVGILPAKKTAELKKEIQIAERP